jgi:hypothetical protein
MLVSWNKFPILIEDSHYPLPQLTGSPSIPQATQLGKLSSARIGPGQTVPYLEHPNSPCIFLK